MLLLNPSLPGSYLYLWLSLFLWMSLPGSCDVAVAIVVEVIVQVSNGGILQDHA